MKIQTPSNPQIYKALLKHVPLNFIKKLKAKQIKVIICNCEQAVCKGYFIELRH